jgi:hypothetical protein
MESPAQRLQTCDDGGRAPIVTSIRGIDFGGEAGYGRHSLKAEAFAELLIYTILANQGGALSGVIDTDIATGLFIMRMREGFRQVNL